MRYLEGTIIYSRLLSIQVALEAMIVDPNAEPCTNKIGAKKGTIPVWLFDFYKSDA